jgi:hypothetical protein
MNAAIPERVPATEEISAFIEGVTFHNEDAGSASCASEHAGSARFTELTWP